MLRATEEPNIIKLNESFDFNWNDYSTFEQSKLKLAAIETNLQYFLNRSSMNDENAQATCLTNL